MWDFELHLTLQNLYSRRMKVVTGPLDQSTNLAIRFSLGRVFSLGVTFSVEGKLEGCVLNLKHGIQAANQPREHYVPMIDGR